MVSNEQSGAYSCTPRGGCRGGWGCWTGREEEEGVVISIATVKSPAVMFGLR